MLPVCERITKPGGLFRAIVGARAAGSNSSGAGLPQDDLCLPILPVCDRITKPGGLFPAIVGVRAAGFAARLSPTIVLRCGAIYQYPQKNQYPPVNLLRGSRWLFFSRIIFIAIVTRLPSNG
jgi:hypothetical protein